MGCIDNVFGKFIMLNCKILLRIAGLSHPQFRDIKHQYYWRNAFEKNVQQEKRYFGLSV